MIIGKKYLLAIWCVISCFGLSYSQDDAAAEVEDPKVKAEKAYRVAIDSISKDLETELAKLAEVRQQITSEKPELARKAADSALELSRKKRQFEVAKATQASVNHQLEKRQKNLELWRDERLYLDGIVADFVKNYRGFMTLPEVNSLEETFKQAAAGGDSGTAASLKLVEQMTKQLSEVGKVKTVEGQALGNDGIMIDGDFAVVGPVSWFIADDESVSGLIRESRSLQPELVEGTSDNKSIKAVVSGEAATLSFDPTLGNAIAMGEVEGDFMSFFRKGGLWIYPILLLAVVAFIAAVAKWVQLLGVRSIRPNTIQKIIDLVNQDKSVAANSEVGSIKHPAGAILARGIEVSDRPIDDVEESLYEKYLEAVPALQRGLPLIAIASATAPLLGLLGTVTGMIKTFNQIAIFGTGDAKSLSGGISEALITTAFGLIVAIPALILHALLSRKIQGIRSTMEMVSLAFVNGLKRKQA